MPPGNFFSSQCECCFPWYEKLGLWRYLLARANSYDRSLKIFAAVFLNCFISSTGVRLLFWTMDLEVTNPFSTSPWDQGGFKCLSRAEFLPCPYRLEFYLFRWHLFTQYFQRFSCLYSFISMCSSNDLYQCRPPDWRDPDGCESPYLFSFYRTCFILSCSYNCFFQKSYSFNK